MFSVLALAGFYPCVLPSWDLCVLGSDAVIGPVTALSVMPIAKSYKMMGKGGKNLDFYKHVLVFGWSHKEKLKTLSKATKYQGTSFKRHKWPQIKKIMYLG